MRNRFPVFVAAAASLVLLVVTLGWYASENFNGQLGRRLIEVGDAIVWPGRMADALLSGNLAGFGSWRSGGIRILVSWMVWGLPLFVAWLIDARSHAAKSEEG